MIVSEVTYTVRRNLGNYQHEELSATVVHDADDPKPGQDMMAEARIVCVISTSEKRKLKDETQEDLPF